MKGLQIFNNSKFGQIRTVSIDDKIYFVAADVASALGYKDTTNAIKQHCRWVVKRHIPHPQSPEKNIEVNTIPEGDIYRLIANSKLPTAEEFEIWVFDEVLPSIRKHGMYAKDELLDNPDLLIQLATKLKEERQEKKLLETENKLLAQENLKWANRKIIEAVIRKYGASKNKGPVGFADAWKEFKKELLYKHSINLNSRITNYINDTGKKNVKTLDMIHDNELQSCISTAVALCRQNKVDISDIIGKFDKTA